MFSIGGALKSSYSIAIITLGIFRDYGLAAAVTAGVSLKLVLILALINLQTLKFKLPRDYN